MTNLEFYKDEIKKRLKHNGFISDCVYQVYVKHYGYCSRNSEEWLFNWLLEEYKEPIKLTQVEYDILASYYENQSITNHNQRLNEYAIFPRLKKTGKYFKDLNLFLTIGEVYKNCEVLKYE